MCMCTCVHNYITYFLRGFAPNGKNEWNKCKNHFNEMKGDVGMSLHEKEGNKKNLHQADNHPYIFVLELTTYNYFLFLCS